MTLRGTFGERSVRVGPTEYLKQQRVQVVDAMAIGSPVLCGEERAPLSVDYYGHQKF
jgi:hypothetical protein